MFTDTEVACVLGVQEVADFFVVNLERAKHDSVECWLWIVVRI